MISFFGNSMTTGAGAASFFSSIFDAG